VAAREDIARAIAEGNAAGKRGDLVKTCPYPRESLLRPAWIRGYARARPVGSA
jgi:ribosome modulation factor